MKKSTVSIKKAKKEKEVVKSQFTILESEKTVLTRSLEEAKAAQDEAVAMAASLQSEQEKLIRVAKAEVEEKLAKALFKKGINNEDLQKKRELIEKLQMRLS